MDPLIMPIEIRPDYFVQIMGIPHDLSAEEARKIAAVVLAMSTPEIVTPSTRRYRARTDFPHQIAVTSIDAYPLESDLPDWDDLRGRAPDATGGLSSEAFVRELRDGWRQPALLLAHFRAGRYCFLRRKAMDKALTAGQEEAYIQMALHDIDEFRGPQRESVQVFREFYRSIKKRMEPKEVDWGPPVGRELI